MQSIFQTEEATKPETEAYDFSAPIDLRTTFSEDSFFVELAATDAFQRLNNIRFLGGIDYLLVRSPNGARGNVRYTRAQHSLGVARLALLYSTLIGLSADDQRLIFAAALLHDVGHAPLSHSLEPVFQDIFGVEHHKMSLDIISGRVPYGKHVYSVLRGNNIDVERLIDLLSGNSNDFGGFFAGPINFDTIEGILRTKVYVKKNAPQLPPELVVDAATRRNLPEHRDLVDTFWNYKDQVYRHVINSTVGILADHVCQLFMRRYLDRISVDDYLTTEDAIFRKLPGLRKLLVSPDFELRVPSYLDHPINFKARRFVISDQADFFQRDDVARYRQTRESRSLKITLPNEQQIFKPTGDLFRDYSD